MAIFIGDDFGESITGTSGDDRITGKGGGDILTGAGGKDVFIYLDPSDATVGNYDVITDLDVPNLSTSGDIIDLSALDIRSISIVPYNQGNVHGGYIFVDTPGGLMQIGYVGYLNNASAIVTSNPLQGFLVTEVNSSPVLYGGDHDDIIYGYAIDNRLVGGSGSDQLLGGSGSDTFVFTPALNDSSVAAPDHILDFASGTDQIELNGSGISSIAVVRSGGTSFLYTGSPAGTQAVVVSGPMFSFQKQFHADVVAGAGATLPAVTIFADNAGDAISTGPVAVTVIGGYGKDTITGGGQADTLYGDSGNDQIETGWNLYVGKTVFSVGPGDNGGNFAFGQAGDDVISGGSNDWLDGGNGIDTITIGMPPADPNGSPIVDRTRPIAVGGTVFGGGGDDIITSYGKATVIDGGAGNDTIRLEQVSNINGTTGSHLLTGGAGADTFIVSTAYGSTPGGASTVSDFETGADHLQLPGGAVSIVRNGSGTLVFDQTAGGTFAVLSVGPVNGGDLSALNQGIYFQGSAGSDAYSASAKGDLILGGGGPDALTGGAGVDTFRFTAAPDSAPGAADVISNFAGGIDKIDLRAVHTSGSDVFGIASNGTSSFVFVDAGGDGTTDMVIGVAGVANLTMADVIWTQPAPAPVAVPVPLPEAVALHEGHADMFA